MVLGWISCDIIIRIRNYRKTNENIRVQNIQQCASENKLEYKSKFCFRYLKSMNIISLNKHNRISKVKKTFSYNNVEKQNKIRNKKNNKEMKEPNSLKWFLSRIKSILISLKQYTKRINEYSER